MTKLQLSLTTTLAAGLTVSVGLEAISLVQVNPIAGVRLASLAGFVLGATALIFLWVIAHRQVRLSNLQRQQIAAVSKAESRHDFHRASQLDQLGKMVARTRSLAEGISGFQQELDSGLGLPYDEASPLMKVLFVTSNGAGMGHLTAAWRLPEAARRSFSHSSYLCLRLQK